MTKKISYLCACLTLIGALSPLSNPAFAGDGGLAVGETVEGQIFSAYTLANQFLNGEVNTSQVIVALSKKKAKDFYRNLQQFLIEVVRADGFTDDYKASRIESLKRAIQKHVDDVLKANRNLTNAKLVAGGASVAASVGAHALTGNLPDMTAAIELCRFVATRVLVAGVSAYLIFDIFFKGNKIPENLNTNQIQDIFTKTCDALLTRVAETEAATDLNQP